MEIEALNKGSGALAQSFTSAQPSNKLKERSLTSEAGNQPKKKAQQDSQMVVAQMPQVKDGQPEEQDEGWQTVGKKTDRHVVARKKKHKKKNALFKKRLP